MKNAFKMKIEDSLAIITFDHPTEKVNILTPKVMEQFAKIIGKLEDKSDEITGAIIVSGKEQNFIAGADLSEIEGVTDAGKGKELARSGQEILARLAELPFTVVAAINGACLGGGLELALACSRRVATDSTRTFLGLPETQLGIIPGFGGTQRLPRLVGVPEALKMITAGSRIYPRKALRIGLVDEVVHPENLMEAARSLVTGPRPRKRKKSLAKRFRQAGMRMLESTSFGRKKIFERARKEVRKRAQDHYPAPLAAIDAVEDGYLHGIDHGYETEAGLLGEMASTEISKNLISVFYLREMFARGDTTPAETVSNIGIIGGGAMGGGIAALGAQRGFKVRLIDMSTEALGKALNLLNKNVSRNRKKGRFTGVQATWIPTRLTVDTQMRGLSRSDVVIEAVAERMDVKKTVLKSVADAAPKDALILSNTSSLSITEMAGAVPTPSRVAGLHFFNPVDRMPLVEVVKGDKTSAKTVEKAKAFTLRLGKIPVVVKDRPGFLVNRLLLPYLNEAARLLEEGAGIEDVDKALLDFGMPMGAFILLDQVGLDIAAHAGMNLFKGFGDRMTPSPILKTMMDAGRLGKKSGSGFYKYNDKGDHKPDPELDDILSSLVKESHNFLKEEIVDRLILPMINEASLCLEEGVVEKPEEVDVAMIFGAGFPPFTGGLLRYADKIGTDHVVNTLDKLADTVDERFRPSEYLRKLASEGKGFFS